MSNYLQIYTKLLLKWPSPPYIWKQECLTGGTIVICIQFNNQDDQSYFYNIFQEYHIDNLQVEEKTYQLNFIYPKENKEDILLNIHTLLKRFILEKKRTDWCKRILEEEFFFTDVDEQIQIIEMVYSILAGKRKDIPLEIDHSLLEERVDQALYEVLQTDQPFSIEAFTTFRLRFYREKLSSYIEVAIDEYKLEQEYQSFIYYLRNFLSDRKAKMNCIYIVNEDDFIFFDENKREMKRSELNKCIDRKLLSDHPVYVDSTTIAPLISIAPEKIYLYTNEPESGIIRTLKNIFEEKLHIYSLHAFSFENG